MSILRRCPNVRNLCIYRENTVIFPKKKINLPYLEDLFDTTQFLSPRERLVFDGLRLSPNVLRHFSTDTACLDDKKRVQQLSMFTNMESFEVFCDAISVDAQTINWTHLERLLVAFDRLEKLELDFEELDCACDIIAHRAVLEKVPNVRMHVIRGRYLSPAKREILSEFVQLSVDDDEHDDDDEGVEDNEDGENEA